VRHRRITKATPRGRLSKRSLRDRPPIAQSLRACVVRCVGQPRASGSRTFALPCGSLRTPKRPSSTRSDKTEAGATPAAIHRERSKIKDILRARKKFFRSRKTFFPSRKTILRARKTFFLSRNVSLRARKIILLSRESILRACKAAFRSQKIVLRSPKTDWVSSATNLL